MITPPPLSNLDFIPSFTCRICNHDEADFYQVPEMMFGMNETFGYGQCKECGCLQISDIPKDLSPYYPENYYSFAPRITKKTFSEGLSSRLLFTFLFSCWPDTKYKRIHSWMRNSHVNYSSKILDVGCGSGELLCKLASAGFKHLVGVDPFLSAPQTYCNGVQLFKENFLKFDNGKYDLIMLHHSFEHMPNPAEIIQKAHQILNENGVLLLRIPTVDSEIWESYREHWFQLDAPRHLFLHSKKSIEFLAKKANFRVEQYVYDSRESQFWASEQYKAGIFHRSSDSFEETGKSSLWTEEQMKFWKKKSKELNRKQRGDAMCIYLRKGEQ